MKREKHDLKLISQHQAAASQVKSAAAQHVCAAAASLVGTRKIKLYDYMNQ